MNWVLIALIAVAGILNTVQAGSNSTLHKILESPAWSVAAVFGVGLVASLAAAVSSGQRFPSAATIDAVPWWGWIGGALGTVYLFSMMLTADKVGAAIFMSITVTMAVITSLVMDHFGLMGFDVHRAGIGRIIGGMLMVMGLGLIAKF
jgi:transporter family-2 protein